MPKVKAKKLLSLKEKGAKEHSLKDHSDALLITELKAESSGLSSHMAKETGVLSYYELVGRRLDEMPPGKARREEVGILKLKEKIETSNLNIRGYERPSLLQRGKQPRLKRGVKSTINALTDLAVQHDIGKARFLEAVDKFSGMKYHKELTTPLEPYFMVRQLCLREASAAYDKARKGKKR